MRRLLDMNWHTVDPPWGDGTHIIAGHQDPHIGVFVTDCQDLSGSREEHGQVESISDAEVAAHIVECHNKAREVRTREQQWQRKAELLQQAQRDMPEPWRSMVCDILANGALREGGYGG